MTRRNEMVRKYKRKRTNYGNWAEESMVAAMRSVRDGNTIRQAASDYGVPRTSLQRRLVLSKLHKSEGRNVLTAKQEADVVELLKSQSSSLTSVDVRRLVFEYVERNNIKNPFKKETGLAGKEWFYGFMKRNKDLTVKVDDSAVVKPVTQQNGHVDVSNILEQIGFKNRPELTITAIKTDIPNDDKSSQSSESGDERVVNKEVRQRHQQKDKNEKLKELWKNDKREKLTRKSSKVNKRSKLLMTQEKREESSGYLSAEENKENSLLEVESDQLSIENEENAGESSIVNKEVRRRHRRKDKSEKLEELWKNDKREKLKRKSKKLKGKSSKVDKKSKLVMTQEKREGSSGYLSAEENKESSLLKVECDQLPIENEENAGESSKNEEKMTTTAPRANNSFHAEIKNNCHNSANITSLKRKVIEPNIMQLPKKKSTLSKANLNISYKFHGDVVAAIRSILMKPSFQEKLVQEAKSLAAEVNALQAKGREINDAFNKMEAEVKEMTRELQESFPEDIDIIDENPSFASYLLSRNKISDLQSSSYMSSRLNHSGNASTLLLQAREKFAFQLMRGDSTSTPVLPKEAMNGVKNGLTPPGLTLHKRINEVDVLVAKPIDKPSLPGIGPITKKELTVGMKVLAMRGNYLSVWQKARIVNTQTNSAGTKYFKVKFEAGRTNSHRVYLMKHLAYSDPSDVILPVGSRIVAHFRDEVWSTRSSLYAGIIAEPPKLMNNYRYLIFFDDGYAQYVKHSEVYLVCESSKDVWEDIYPDARDFIKNYLKEYPERPMVKLQQGQVIKTEWNGSWWTARVVEVDASLVKMFFHADRRTEWIYRGSTRLAPLYEELATAEANRLAGKNRRHNIVTKKKHQPYVEYTRSVDEPLEQPIVVQPVQAPVIQSSVDNVMTPSFQEQRPQVARKHTGGIPTAETISVTTVQRNVAKKSTTQILTESPVKEITLPFVDSQYGLRENYRIKYYSIAKYVPHECSPNCLNKEDLGSLHGSNPLSKPMATGWERQIVKHRVSNKRVTFYRGPCGRRLREMSEVHRYLQETKSKLTVDLFCFDSIVSPVAEFNPGKVNCKIADITYGKEKLPVSCVNNMDYEYPPMIEYSSTRFPAKGVNMNLDPEFLCGCDCEDNCSDRDRCQCQQLTVSATSALPTGKIPNAGYKYRRLLEPLITGVYECNSRCKCGPGCFNRVVQNGLSVRLQVFKTERRGWGIRSLNDIPQGMFICIYAGQLLTEQGANEDGNQYGDEYLAELDHIEVIERFKEGYESDVIEPEDSKEDIEEKSGSDIESEDDSSYKVEKVESHSSDSDFDVSVKSPIEPSNHITRSNSKMKESEAETDSNCSTSGKFSVPHSPAEPHENVEYWMKSISVPKAVKEGKYFTGHWASSSKVNMKVKGEADDDMELPDLDTETSNTSKSNLPILDDINKIKLIRRPRVTKRLSRRESSDQDNDSQSSSEEERIKTDAVSFTSETESEDAGKCKKPCLKSLGSVPDKKMPIMPSLRPNWVNPNKPKFTSLRSFFSEEYCYIMDAKNCGNIGRYLNHSCCPNVFVQNVFVDTHDLRFPWVAFFAMTYIRAGTELTWDYNYDVGSVPGKVMYCYCGSSECRGRLL